MSGEKKRQMPKGGRKGGKQFPQIGLKDAVEYAKKLVSKTHTGSQPASIILTGVFGSGTSKGQIRASAMKQFGLMDGLAEAYVASDLAKKIVVAPPAELQPLLRAAVLKPEVFKSLYETFKGDKVSSAKIRQQASNLEVHPDNLDKCVSLFMESIQYAGLGQANGDEISLVGAQIESQPNGADGNSIPELPAADDPAESDSNATSDSQKQAPAAKKAPASAPAPSDHAPSGRSVIHVNIDLDSSLDTEKLEKQLELLRRYGAI